jgi:hypothetical protein
LLAKNYITDEKNINSTNVNDHQQMFEALYQQNKNCELVLNDGGETSKYKAEIFK